jgi:hypothetical protein
MKKIISIAMMAAMSLPLFAQNSRTDINSMLNSWFVPVIGLGLFVGFVGLVWHNIDAIRGKNGASKQDGWMAVGEGMVYIVLVVAALTFVASKLAGMTFSI